MKMNLKYSLMFAAALTVSAGLVSCGDDDNNTTSGGQSNNGNQTDNGGQSDINTSRAALEAKLVTTNKEFVENTVIPTYRNLADYNKKLVEALEAMNSDETVRAACDMWKQSRKWWEYSEAFLFGPASDYSIDPHTDTWPFDKAAFDNFMSKYHPATNEADADYIDQAIATGQNLTGFHAVEYLIFREGQPRKFADMTADEIYFAKSAAKDLYLSSLKLVAAWNGKLSDDEQKWLEDEEFSYDNYGDEFRNAGKAGSRYKSVLDGAIHIIAGANEIIGEVRDSKIGNPANGADPNYIESPHAHNSITDFYDNIMSCKHTLYGGYTMEGNTPSETSLIGVCLQIAQTKDAAVEVEKKLDAALAAIKKMKEPFVTYYTDQSAKDAMSALDELEKSLDALSDILSKYE